MAAGGLGYLLEEAVRQGKTEKAKRGSKKCGFCAAVSARGDGLSFVENVKYFHQVCCAVVELVGKLCYGL